MFPYDYFYPFQIFLFRKLLISTRARRHCCFNCSWRALFWGGHTLSKTAVGRTWSTMDSFVSAPCNIVRNLNRLCWQECRWLYFPAIRGVLLR